MMTDWYPLPKATTVSIIVPAPGSLTSVQTVSAERNSARRPVIDARKDARIIRKSSVQIMKNLRLSAMPVTIGFAAACAGCFITPSMLSSSMNRDFLSPVKGSPSQNRN